MAIETIITALFPHWTSMIYHWLDGCFALLLWKYYSRYLNFVKTKKWEREKKWQKSDDKKPNGKKSSDFLKKTTIIQLIWWNNTQWNLLAMVTSFFLARKNTPNGPEKACYRGKSDRQLRMNKVFSTFFYISREKKNCYCWLVCLLVLCFAFVTQYVYLIFDPYTDKCTHTHALSPAQSKKNERRQQDLKHKHYDINSQPNQ